jgi:hypothetical protein
MAAQEVGKAPLTAVEAGASPGQDEEKMVTLLSAQEAGGESQTAVEARPPTR